MPKRTICGVDEAGRGPLAGPVVASAVVLDRAQPIDGLADSKTLTAEERERLFAEIVARAWVVTVLATPARIDRMNIRAATLWAMSRAVRGLYVEPTLVLVDGRDKPPDIDARVLPVIGGDGRSPAIAAASIVAKVTRDRLMVRLGAADPRYGFEKHKGYATPAHTDALWRYGPSQCHRFSFAPVRDAKAACRAAHSQCSRSATPMPAHAI